MNAYIFHITPYDLVFLGTIFIGLTFALLLGFAKRINRTANRFLGLALAIIILWMAWVLGIDIRLGTYFPRWSWLPLQFSLTLGPLIYFYVLKMTRPEYKLRRKDLLHFSPLLLQQGILVLEIKESIRTGAATYGTLTFQQLSPVLQLLAFVSVILYLYWSYRLIQDFYQRLKFNGNDRYRYELRWLHRLLRAFSLLWLLWIPFTAADYFYYHYFSSSGHLDGGGGFFKRGGWPAGRNPSVFKAAASCGNEAKGYLAKESHESQPLLPGPRTKLKLAG